MEFKVEKDKKSDEKLFILEHDEIKIILSNPRVQPFNEYRLSCKEDFFHFYYNLTIYEKHRYGGRPTKIFEGYITEFGVIQYLPEFIEETLSFDMHSLKDKNFYYERDNKREIILSKTDWWVSKSFKLNGMLNEDVYKITRTLHYRDEAYNVKKERNEKHVFFEEIEMFIGGGDKQVKTNTNGVILYLDKDDLRVVSEWAKAFIDYTIKKEQEYIDSIFNKNYEDITDEDTNYKDEYYYPYLFKKYMKEKYPEDMDKFREIYTTLYHETFILEEYYKRIKGEEIEEPLFSKWDNPFTADDYIKQGDKEWVAYLKLLKRYYKEAHNYDLEIPLIDKS